MPRTLQLAAVGTVAGLFSGVFGVGGGVVIVPLLALALGYPTRVAAATSLAAIAVIAAAAGAPPRDLRQHRPTRRSTDDGDDDG